MGTTTQSSGIMSNNRVRVSAIPEVTWGDTPATPAFQELRVTGSSFTSNQTTSESNEVRSDRMNAATLLQSAEASGSIDTEISSDSHEQFMQSALFWDTADITDTSTSVADITLTAAGGLVVSAAGTPFADLIVGQWLYMEGFAIGTNDGYFQVVTVTSSASINVDDPDSVLADDVAGNTIEFRARTFRNSIDGWSFTVQEEYLDHSPVTYVNSKGMYVGEWSLSIASGADVTQTFSFQGKNSVSTESQFAGATLLGANSNEVMDSLTMNLTNNLRNQQAVGIGAESVGIGFGKLSLTVDLELYFLNHDERTDFDNRTNKALTFRLEDPSNNAIIITIPQAKYSAFDSTGAANDSDTTSTGTITAEVFDNGAGDPSSEHMIQVDMITAP